MTRKRKRPWGQIWPGNGRDVWKVRWHENGQERQRTIKGSKALAERWLAKKHNDLGEQEALGRAHVDPVRFEDFFAQYEALFTGDKAPPTVRREQLYLTKKALPFFRGMEMSRITRADIERWLVLRMTTDKIKPGTRNKLVNMMSKLFQKAMALNHARENPCAGIKRKQEVLKVVPFVPLDEQEKIIATTPEPVRWLIALQIDTGLRLGETMRLEWSDVDFRRAVVRVRESKTPKGRREVPFTDRGRLALESARKAFASDLPRVPDLVFPDFVGYWTGEARLRNRWHKMWRVARVKAGWPSLTIHDLRHVWAVNCVRAGVSLGELQGLGGWESLVMVLRYARYARENSPDLARTRLQDFINAGESRQGSRQGSMQ